MASDDCALCGQSLSEGATVKVSRGLSTLRAACEFSHPAAYNLLENVHYAVVHVKCRKDITRRSIEPGVTPKVPLNEGARNPLLRSSQQNFDFAHHCLLCSVLIPATSGLAKYNISTITQDRTKDHLLSVCEKRSDTWSDMVRTRIILVPHLSQVGARYHRKCYSDFISTDRKFEVSASPASRSPSSPATFISPVASVGSENRTPLAAPRAVPAVPRQVGRKRGRPIDPVKSQAFLELCEYLETSDECQFTYADLMLRMGSAANSGCYGEKHLERLLRAHYGDTITTVHRPGQSSVLCFAETTAKLLSDAWYASKKANKDAEHLRIVEAAAAIIVHEIKSTPFDCDVYPSLTNLQDGSWTTLPKSLRALLFELFVKGRRGDHGKLIRKATAVGQDIIAGVRPTSYISPIQLSLGVHVHRSFGSRNIVDILYSLGKCSSYAEVTRYEKAVVKYAKARITEPQSAFVQFAFDNFDFNVNTLDGLNTVHIMGGIECVTPTEAVSLELQVPRKPVEELEPDMSCEGNLEVEIYQRPPTSGLKNIMIADLRPGTECRELSSTTPAEYHSARLQAFLWLCGSTFQASKTPGWAGFMEKCTENAGPVNATSIIPLPFVNLDANNLSTIYTCLSYAARKAEKYGHSKAVVTFDQPLFLKATEMVLSAGEGSPLKRVVVRLGGFHLLMNFMGAVGYIMAGSGIEELWSTVYAQNTLPHLTSGKAFSRAFRAHLLTQRALFATICEEVLDCDSVLRSHFARLFNNVYKQEIKLADAVKDHILASFVERFDAATTRLSETRMGKLWCLYFKMVELMKVFVQAERTGNWALHLFTTQQMLFVFKSAGHFKYLQASQLYLQMMYTLEQTMSPTEFENFVTRGYFTVRGKKFWSGRWSDLTIEQSLMRPLKTAGGLTRGRGMTDSTAAIWIHGMPSFTLSIQALEAFCGQRAVISEQHVENRESRQSRNELDTGKFVRWLQTHPPFYEPHILRSLSTGMAANETVNCDRAFEVGLAAMASMVGKSFAEATYQKKDRVVNLASMSVLVQVDDQHVPMNAQTLAHRIICTVETEEELIDCFKFELAPVPAALFDGQGMRKGTKSTLTKALEDICPTDNMTPENALFVIDGGHLLHRVVWSRPITYKQVVQRYCNYVVRHYSSSATVVFDGYSETPSTKDPEHQRRSTRTTSVDFSGFELDMELQTTQSKFLSNWKNKALLITFLQKALFELGVTVLIATSDADRLIAQSTIDLSRAQDRNVVTVADDTDVLVLLVALACDSRVYFMVPGTAKTPTKVHDIHRLRTALGDAAKGLLFLHAVSGCDTTSALHGRGKTEPLRKFQGSKNLQELAQVFYLPNASHTDLSSAGERTILELYGYADQPDLGAARYAAYIKMVARRPLHSQLDMAQLPPTADAARWHSFRVYHQVQTWLGRDLPPESWGWQLRDGRFQPVATTAPPAPDRILRMTACKCKGDCSTRRCPCKAAGLPCLTVFCKCGGSCVNTPPDRVLPEDQAEADVDDPDAIM